MMIASIDITVYLKCSLAELVLCYNKICSRRRLGMLFNVKDIWDCFPSDAMILIRALKGLTIGMPRESASEFPGSNSIYTLAMNPPF